MDKKLLVVKPPYWHVPLGIAYVLSCLERNNIQFDFIDTTFVDPDYDKILKKNNYLAFAVGGLNADFEFIYTTIRKIRSIQPGLPVILGGNITKDINHHILFDKDKLGIDFGIVGEAETSLPHLVNRLNMGTEDFSGVPGLLYKDKKNGEIIKNIPVRLDLESVNILPAWHRINMEQYKHCNIPFMKRQIALPVVTGRGCVGACSFCSPTVGAFRMRPIKHVIEEIEFLFSTYDFELLFILNEMFYRTKDEILAFCNAYKNVKSRKPWICSMRADVSGIDADTFSAMKESGCVLTSAGIESGSDRVLKMMNKQTTIEQVKKFYRAARTAGLPCVGTFMVANEGETEEELKQTIDMVTKEEMNCDGMLLDTYSGTRIYKNALKKGLIKDEWDHLRQTFISPYPYLLEWTDRMRYLNISEIPDNRFWDVIFRELRRFHTFLFNRFQALDFSYRPLWLLGSKDRPMGGVKLKGKCSECGNITEAISEYNLLGQIYYCSNCFSPIFFNFYKLNDFIAHYEMLCSELKKARRLVVVGTRLQAMNILKYDHFGLDYEKLIGFVEIRQNQLPSPDFGNKKRLKLKDLININPDVILIADDLGYAELSIKMFYCKKRMKIPEILHIFPDKKRWGMKLIRLYDKLDSAAGSVKIISLTFGFLCIRILKLKMVVPMMISLFRYLIKHVFGENIFLKAKHLYIRYLK
ncbi:MAG: radical SAM protein [Elusimicrobia bacterium]|nr:radical SAM protein [Elusimicrobiota bacterium]